MSLKFQDLIAQYGTARNIPDAVLYDAIMDEHNRQNIGNLAKLGLERFTSAEIVAEVRRRSKQDLYWLARYFLWPSSYTGAGGKPISENLINEATHRPLCDNYVHKDDSKSIAEQDPLYKERLFLYPRGSYKSTIDVCDAVQWVLNFPHIRILFMTATVKLAQGFLDEAAGHFVIRPFELSPMNLFFPEFCIEEKDLVGDSFTCPLWAAKQTKRKEPTIMATSIVSTMSGYHFEVLKPDDIVETDNSGNDEMCQKVSKNFHINAKMLLPYGYIDMNGTRYAEEDHYGSELVKNVGELKIVRGMDNPDDPRPWEATYNTTTGKIIVIGKAWEPHAEAKLQLAKQQVKEEELKERDYALLFPEYMTYPWLRRKQKEDEPSFEGQLMQNPRPKSRIAFDRDLLVRHTVPFQQVPMAGPIIITWDFAFSKKKGRDYSTAAVGIYNNKGQLFIIDLIRQRFNATTLAKAVVDNAERYHPAVLAIENTSGSRFLEPTIIAEAERRAKPWLLSAVRGIDWFTPDQQKDAKRVRMMSAHPWLMNDRLFFVSHLPFLDTLYGEFETCLISHHHDDIPDVIAQMLRYVPKVHTMILKHEIPTWSREDAQWNLLFEENVDAFGRIGFGGAGPIPVSTAPPDLGLRPETPNPELPSILGGGLCG